MRPSSLPFKILLGEYEMLEQRPSMRRITILNDDEDMLICTNCCCAQR